MKRNGTVDILEDRKITQTLKLQKSPVITIYEVTKIESNKVEFINKPYKMADIQGTVSAEYRRVFGEAVVISYIVFEYLKHIMCIIN